MKTKLTLTVSKSAIDKAKRFAKKRRSSVSALFERWVNQRDEALSVEPLSERLAGKWQGSDSKDPRLDYLLEKHTR